jgi:prepilin-type N-terminal cleavage/methylation domain-containing protein
MVGVEHTQDLSRRARRALHADDGVTLVELLVAITVLLVVMAGIAAGATSGLQLARGNTNRIVAANIADERIGEVRAMEFADIPQTVQSLPPETRGAVTYQVTQSAEMVFLGAEGSCESPSGPFNTNELSYLRVVVEVAWPEMEGIAPVRSETIIDPPVADFDPYRGHLAVKVIDRDGAPVQGMTVRLRNADAATPAKNTFEVTDAEGCAFFGNLDVVSGETVGNYHVWLNEAGYVDRASGLTDTSGQSPQPVVNIVSAQLRKIEFNYDRAAYLDMTPRGTFGGALPQDPLSIWIANDNYNSGLGPKRFVSPAALSATALHPFQAGFSVYAGNCNDADPGAANRVRFVTDPGVRTPGDVTIGTVEVTVLEWYYNNGWSLRPAANEIVRATDGCGNSARFPSARTDSSGTTTIALPYGTWTIRVEGRGVYPSWPQVTLAHDDAAATTATVQAYP